MSDNYELDDVEVKPFMEEVNQQVQHLTKLKWAVEEATEALKQAETAYDKFVKETFCQVFRANGLESLVLADGRRINVVTKTTCSINKNDKDKANVANWLREHNGAELVKAELHVTPEHKSELDAMGIPNEETTTMNTNAVKAFLLDQLGQKGSPAQISIDELPKGINFYQYDDVEIVG